MLLLCVGVVVWGWALLLLRFVACLCVACRSLSFVVCVIARCLLCGVIVRCCLFDYCCLFLAGWC